MGIDRQDTGGDQVSVMVHPDRDDYDSPVGTRGGYTFSLIIGNHKGRKSSDWFSGARTRSQTRSHAVIWSGYTTCPFPAQRRHQRNNSEVALMIVARSFDSAPRRASDATMILPRTGNPITAEMDAAAHGPAAIRGSSDTWA
jgi:hypothetical protein